jgi:uncharacterized protein GlcG (DUF336 family)
LRRAATRIDFSGYAPEENALSMTVRMGDFINVPGGFLIMFEGEVIGAVAVGGASIDQDVMVAQAALQTYVGRDPRAVSRNSPTRGTSSTRCRPS